MRTRRGLGRWAAAFLLAALLVAACTAHGVISTGPDGLRTFAVIRNPDGSSVPCAAFGLTNPVAGILEGQAGAREPVWLRAEVKHSVCRMTESGPPLAGRRAGRRAASLSDSRDGRGQRQAHLHRYRGVV